MNNTVDELNDETSNLPVANYLIMMLMSLSFAWQNIYDPGAQHLKTLVLTKLSLSSMFGYSWLQTNNFHFVENLVTLWILGQHVSTKMQKRVYLLSYVLLGIAAAIVHLIFDGRPMIGASGAIMGILGIHTVICFKKFGVIGPWLIILWLSLTAFASINNTTAIAHMAHFGGFLFGMLLGVVILYFKGADLDDTDPDLCRFLSYLRPNTILA